MSIRTAEWRFFYPLGDDVFLFGRRIIDWIATDLPCNDKVKKGIHLGPVVHTSLKLRATRQATG